MNTMTAFGKSQLVHVDKITSDLAQPNKRIQPTANSAAPIVALLFASADACR